MAMAGSGGRAHAGASWQCSSHSCPRRALGCLASARRPWRCCTRCEARRHQPHLCSPRVSPVSFQAFRSHAKGFCGNVCTPFVPAITQTCSHPLIFWPCVLVPPRDTNQMPPSLKCGVVHQELYMVGTCYQTVCVSGTSSSQDDEEMFDLQRYDHISCGCANSAACKRKASSESSNFNTIAGR